MEEFEKIRNLIRLKRFESPPADFVDGFVSRLHERQRSELLKQSSLGMFWEQIRIWFDQTFAPKWALATAVTLAAAVPAWMLLPGDPKDREYSGRARSVTLAIDESGRTIPAFSIDALRIVGAKVEADPGLLSKHFQGSYDQFIIVSECGSEDTIAVPHDLAR